MFREWTGFTSFRKPREFLKRDINSRCSTLVTAAVAAVMGSEAALLGVVGHEALLVLVIAQAAAAEGLDVGSVG